MSRGCPGLLPEYCARGQRRSCGATRRGDPMTATECRAERAAVQSPTGVSLPDPRPARPRTARTALALGALVALGPLTIDMSLPALPTITTDLETTSAAVHLTLTGTLIGLALG